MSEPNAAERRTETGAASADSDAQRRERILEALQLVNDPELGFSVIDLELIKEIAFTPDEVEVKMIFTTPFCPYGSMLVGSVEIAAEAAVELPVKVTVLPDPWVVPVWLR